MIQRGLIEAPSMSLTEALHQFREDDENLACYSSENVKKSRCICMVSVVSNSSCLSGAVRAHGGYHGPRSSQCRVTWCR